MKLPPNTTLDTNIVGRERNATTYWRNDYGERYLSDDDPNKIICNCTGTKNAIQKCMEDCRKWERREDSPFDAFQLSARKICRQEVEQRLDRLEKEFNIPDIWHSLEVRGISDPFLLRGLSGIGLAISRLGTRQYEFIPAAASNTKSIKQKLPNVLAILKERYPNIGFIFH
jgi:hypothetical protein